MSANAQTTLFSLLGAGGVAVVTAYVTARFKVRHEMRAQRETKILELSGKYVTPLRYYAKVLSDRLGEIEKKLQDKEQHDLAERAAARIGALRETRGRELKAWFEEIQCQVKRRDDRLEEEEYLKWCYYEGIFAASTLYYTFSYFYCMRELRYFRPFGEDRPGYSEMLEDRLTDVANALHWAEEEGIYRESQELMGERFQRDGMKMAYAEMCDEHVSGDLLRRAPFYRAVDVFAWDDLDEERVRNIKAALGKLVQFLYHEDPVKSD